MTSKIIYHYVYRITNLVENKHYYGKRSSKVHPKLDIGIKYFSSSKDKQFKQDQLDNPSHYKYKIICIKDSSQEAIELESRLHYLFDVGRNQSFYNRARQTKNGWDFAGCLHSEETRLKISIAQKGNTLSKETRLKMSIAKAGRIRDSPSKETRQKISIANTGITRSDVTKLKMSIVRTGKIRGPYQKGHKSNQDD